MSASASSSSSSSSSSAQQSADLHALALEVQSRMRQIEEARRRQLQAQHLRAPRRRRGAAGGLRPRGGGLDDSRDFGEKAAQRVRRTRVTRHCGLTLGKGLGLGTWEFRALVSAGRGISLQRRFSLLEVLVSPLARSLSLPLLPLVLPPRSPWPPPPHPPPPRRRLRRCRAAPRTWRRRRGRRRRRARTRGTSTAAVTWTT